MSDKRIVEIVEPCTHGWTTNHSIDRGSFYNERPCAGGSRRVLTEGEYLLIEKEAGEWPKWAARTVSAWVDESGNKKPAPDRLDALADHTGETP